MLYSFSVKGKIYHYYCIYALFAVDAEKGVCTYGGRECKAALDPGLN